VIAVILAGTLAATLFLVLGARDLRAFSASRQQAIDAVIGDELYAGSTLERYDRAFRGTALGRRLERELILAGVSYRPVVVFAAGVGTGLLSAVLLWRLLAPAFGVLGLAVGVFAVRGYVRRERERRREAFIAQMPELARVLANAANAGLSIPTAVAMAGEELDEPARGEMQRVATRLGFGAGIEAALSELSARLPSREVAVLVATLAVSARSGGSLVTALRDIAETLEDRKETRREIRTTLAQSVATGYIVVGLGVLILVMLNTISPGTVEKMTRQPIGQISLVVVGTLYAVGILIVRRMTRFEP
jgi:tight adherence protein B